jgi:hypothetical protein
MSFRVPEKNRIDGDPDQLYGAFLLPSPEPGWMLAIIACDGTDTSVPVSLGWEHVSVHARTTGGKTRTPTWKEMAFVKNEFWEDEDAVVQFHPRRSQYVNVHPDVLHLWRHRSELFPEPPSVLVG